MHASLQVSRAQVLAFRRATGSLDRRLPAGAASLRRAAWAGLQDSVPRAALFSLHARVEGVTADTARDGSIVQLWGPRHHAYAVPADDRALFTLGRLPAAPSRQARAHRTAEALASFLGARRMPFAQAARGMGVPPNSLRYAAPTGTVLIDWDGAHQPLVWTVPPPPMDSAAARADLLRRFLHIFGPSTPTAFARWAGVPPAQAHSTWHAIAGELLPVHTPAGAASILLADEPLLRAPAAAAAPARLLPSGDTYFLCWGSDRNLLVPDAAGRARLWTARVWPGALLLHGEVAGTWRRSGKEVRLAAWRALHPAERSAAEAEALLLPLPGPRPQPISILWD